MKIFNIEKIYTVIFLGCFFVGSCSASPSYSDIENAIEAATLTRKQHAEPYDISLPISEYSNRLIDIQNALNQVWSKKSKDAGFAKYLLNLWGNALPSIPDESWEEVNHPIVKMEIAQLLGQARRKCLINTGTNELRQYVLEHLGSSNKSVKLVAISSLGSVGNSEDIPTLSKIILREEEGWAETASESLMMMSSKEAIARLKQLRKSVKRKSLQDFISNTLSDYGEGVSGILVPSCAL